MSVGRRQQELLDVERRDRALPDRDRRARTRRPPGSTRAPARRTASPMPGEMPVTTTRSFREQRRSSSGSRCSPRRRSELAHRRHELEEPRVPRASRRCAGTAGRCRRAPAMRPGRGLMTTTRVERKTASEIEWVTKTTVEPSSLPDREQLEVQALAGHLVERAERLVHQQERRLERRARGRSRRAAACRPRAATGSGRRTRPARRARASPRRAACASRGPSRAARAAAPMFFEHGAPVEEHGVLEDDAVVAVARAPGAPSCRSR